MHTARISGDVIRQLGSLRGCVRADLDEDNPYQSTGKKIKHFLRDIF
jgi:hypothetical protein